MSHVSNQARSLNFGLNLHLHPYFVYASSRGIFVDVPEPLLLNNVTCKKIS